MSDQVAASGLDSLVLSDIAHVEMGQSPDSRYVVEDPLVGLAFLQGNAEFGAVYPKPKFGCLRPAKTCKTNDVLISVRAPVGAVNLADRDYCIGRGLAAIRGRGIKPSLLGEVVARQSAALRRVAQGTTFEAISKNDLLTLKLRLAPRTDWSQIAQILDTLDTAIHETEAVIAKLKAVKQGLLHELLTRGIDANGELRPPQAEAPQLYKRSPLGWIPKEWELSTVGAEFEIQLGKMLDSQKNAGVLKPYIGNKAVQWDRIDISEVQQVRLSKSDLLRFRLQRGDLLVCEGGEVGRAAIWEDELRECYYQKALHRLRPLHGYRPRLMLELLRHLMSKDALSEYVSKTSIAHLTQEKLAAVPLPTPADHEQDRIVAEILAANHREEAEYAQLQKFRLLKTGLMDDLLTGRVRVTPLLAGAEPAKECD